MTEEVDLDASYEDLRAFTKNIFDQAGTTGSSFKDIEIRTAYWTAATQVLLTRKLDVALDGLRQSVVSAKDSSNAASAAALEEACRMRRATWALVGVTLLLTLATAGLVFYTRALVDGGPVVILAPAPSK